VSEPTNVDRASWANKAVLAFMAETGTDYDDSLGDLLCDLMHWTDSAQFDFEAALCRARDMTPIIGVVRDDRCRVIANLELVQFEETSVK
jgi:hypothetical protein